MLLAGDIGGTKALVGLFDAGGRRPVPVAVEEFATAQHPGLEPLIEELLARHGVAPRQVAAAAFGVAGPVLDQVASLTNVDWAVDGRAIAERCGVARVLVLNDLEAMAHAVPVLAPQELHVLQEGTAVADGNAGLIAAGTGLGEALLVRTERGLVPSPTEGGHADFAPRTLREVEILYALTAEFGRVDVERVISGPGLVNIHHVLHRDGGACPARGNEPRAAAAAISAAALSGSCTRCVETLDLFVSAYGAEAGNLALRSMATAGVYVGGGIAPRMLAALSAGPFMSAFRAKAPMEALMSSIPVSVILNRQVGLLGAAVAAAGAAGSVGSPKR